MKNDNQKASLWRALKLYAVTDRAWLHGRTLPSQVEQAILGGATMVQLREKDLPPDEFLAEARIIKEITKKYNVPLIINDNIEVALACGADGVHVGQSDTSAAETRRQIKPDMLLGVSVDTPEQAVIAQRCGADYLGAGAVFPTGTKLDADYVPPAALSNICAAVTIPVVAIGGIHAGNLGELAGTGIAGIAVVSALFAAEDVRAAAEELCRLTGGLW